MAEPKSPVGGVIPAVMTPFAEGGSVDMTALEEQMMYLRDGGVDGLFIGGTTAEGAYLSAAERVEALRLARRVGSGTGAGSGTLTLYAVILRPHTDLVLEELEALGPDQPDYVAAVTPFYYPVSQGTILDHYTRIAEASPVPVLLYNIPQNTHNTIAVETMLTLAEHPNIAGVKDSSGSFMSFSRGMLSRPGADFAWIQGEDLLDGPSLLCGAPGVVTGLGNVWIEPYVKMRDAARAGDIEAVKDEQRKINTLAGIIAAAGGAVIPSIKTAAAVLGRGSARMRIPAETIPDQMRPAVEAVLRGLGLV